MKIFSGIFLLLCLVALTSCAATEYLALDMDKKVNWRKGFEQGHQNQPYIVEYVPEGETVDNWTKMLSIQNFPAKSVANLSTPEAFMNVLKAKMQSRCPTVFWDVIQKGEADILYEWRIENCSPNPDQHEIAKVIFSKMNVFAVHYVSKVKVLPENERKDWIERLRNADIVNKQ